MGEPKQGPTENTAQDLQENTGQWAILPAKVRYDSTIPANAKLIYAEIAAKANVYGYCFCHNSWFAEKFRLKPDTVSSLITRLEKAGYIATDIDNARVNTDRRRIYLTAAPYDFLGGIGFKSDTRPGFKSEGASDKNPGPIENRDIKINIPPKAPQGGRREPKNEPDWMPERFKAFWAAYPRGEKKQAAIAAWDKLHADERLLKLMAMALKRQLASEEWQRGIGIPYASSWLNGRRWEDEGLKPLSESSGSRYEVELWT